MMIGAVETDMLKIQHYKCHRCEYQWVPRTGEPKSCPNCKSRYWNQPRKREKKPKQEKVSIEIS
jgi:predicted Zn-ribbon and HTH transcriptional regulator